jgi:hypothetical protein
MHLRRIARHLAVVHHTAIDMTCPGKSQTYWLEVGNAELNHDLARLESRSAHVMDVAYP